MSRLDELPPDQRAALSLLVRQRRTYADVAAMLEIPELSVHDRAHAALAVLAPAQARGLAPEQREIAGDFVLGQDEPGSSAEEESRALLAGPGPARDWAQAVRAELEPLGGKLPELPPLAPAAAAETAAAATPTPASEPRAAGAPPAAASPPGPPPRTPRDGGGGAAGPRSRLGGAILLAAIVAAIVVAVVLINKGGGHSSHSSTQSTTAAKSSKVKVTAQIPMRSPNPASHAVGAVDVLSEGSREAFFIAAEKLPPTHGFYYAIWLYNSPTSAKALNRAPAVTSTGTLQGGSLLPADAGNYKQILLTRETESQPATPGPIELQGNFTLGG